VARSQTSFKPGNSAARTHGARSQKTGADTGSIRAQTLEEFPHLADQPELLGRLVTARSHVQELRAYLSREGLLDGRGHPRKALDLLRAREKDVADCVKLIQAGVPTLELDGVPAWKISQWRLRAKFAETRAEAVTWLTARGLPVPELTTTVHLAPDGKHDPPLPWPAGYVEEQNRLWRAAHASKEEPSN
jgi:hypothetical protein